MTLTTEATTTIPFDIPDELATAEAVDVTLIGEAMETVDIGPFDGRYYRIAAVDLLVSVDQIRRLANAVEDAVLEARQERMDAQRRECPGCHTLLDEEEQTCGASRCERIYAMDAS